MNRWDWEDRIFPGRILLLFGSLIFLAFDIVWSVVHSRRGSNRKD